MHFSDIVYFHFAGMCLVLYETKANVLTEPTGEGEPEDYPLEQGKDGLG